MREQIIITIMKSKTLVFTAVITCLLGLRAHAQEVPQPAMPQASEAAAKPTSPQSASKTLPRISVRWDCGDCVQNPKVGPLIEKSYTAEATAQGYEVSANESAEVVIKEYRQRPPAARALLGMFAGKDLLATQLKFRGKEYAADDYALNAWQGMNSLCESVAQQALAHVLVALKD